jgi:hypothetical protein
MDWAKLGGTWRLLLVVLGVVMMAGCGAGSGGSDATPQQLTGGGAGGDPGAATGTALLSWAPPMANNDGSPVDLMGFVIYVGSSPQNLQAVRMVNAIDTSVLIDSLPVGTYYFAVTAVSIDGAESTFSNIESKTIS